MLNQLLFSKEYKLPWEQIFLLIPTQHQTEWAAKHEVYSKVSLPVYRQINTWVSGPVWGHLEDGILATS